MNILAVDDELNALDGLKSALSRALPEAIVHTFRSGAAALAFAKDTRCEVAFLDIEMRDISGLEMAKRLKEQSPYTNVVFVTGYSEYAIDAFQVNASGYLLKPVTAEKIMSSMENLRNPIAPKPPSVLRVQCFGNFEVFWDDEPIKFKYHKTKELFAYLIDRKGTVCYNGELMAILWEDEAGERKRSYLSNLSLDLINTLSSLGCTDVVMKRRGALYVVPEKLNCDYYDWDRGLLYAVNSYCGEYMSQYSWAEMTLGAIERKNE